MIDWLKRSFGPIEQPDPGGWRARQAAARSATQTRAIDSFTNHPGLTEQLLAVQGLHSRPWRVASIREALGVPSNYRSVELISNTVGSLAVEAYRDGALLPHDETPQLVKRPDPFTIARDFKRNTAYDMVTRGEFWWWIAARDIDRRALSLIRIAPWEIKVENTDDRLRPNIFWGNRQMRLEDLRHGTLQPDPDSLSGPWQRGVGAMQLCGAAISVQVESELWAANFFGEDGGYPSLVIKAAGELGTDDEGNEEADILRDQWMSKPHNTPRVIDDGIESVQEFGANTASNLMEDAREQNKGTSANMFGVPGALLEYGRPGSSLTYQTVTEVFTTFVRTTLVPNYITPIEEHLSDLLTRSTVAHFNVDGFLRADIKTRYEVYKMGIESGVLSVEEARRDEGIDPGDMELAPIPFSPPQAVPASLPVTRTAAPLRCDGKRPSGKLAGARCNRLLSEDGMFVGRCPRCGKAYASVA